MPKKQYWKERRREEARCEKKGRIKARDQTKVCIAGKEKRREEDRISNVVGAQGQLWQTLSTTEEGKEVAEPGPVAKKKREMLLLHRGNGLKRGGTRDNSI